MFPVVPGAVDPDGDADEPHRAQKHRAAEFRRPCAGDVYAADRLRFRVGIDRFRVDRDRQHVAAGVDEPAGDGSRYQRQADRNADPRAVRQGRQLVRRADSGRLGRRDVLRVEDDLPDLCRRLARGVAVAVVDADPGYPREVDEYFVSGDFRPAARQPDRGLFYRYSGAGRRRCRHEHDVPETADGAVRPGIDRRRYG